ncbi:hypothetical protein Dimus_028814, partial [Dionaea muscipula]
APGSANSRLICDGGFAAVASVACDKRTATCGGAQRIVISFRAVAMAANGAGAARTARDSAAVACKQQRHQCAARRRARMRTAADPTA